MPLHTNTVKRVKSTQTGRADFRWLRRLGSSLTATNERAAMIANTGSINLIDAPSGDRHGRPVIQLSVPVNGEDDSGAIEWAESVIKAASLLYPHARIDVNLDGNARLDPRLLPAIECCRHLVEARGGSFRVLWSYPAPTRVSGWPQQAAAPVAHVAGGSAFNGSPS